MATPTISNVTGTVGTGNTLTVTGTNLYRGGSTENTTGWDSGLSEDDALLKGSTFANNSVIADANDTLDSNVQLIAGSKSVRVETSGATTGNHVGRWYYSDVSSLTGTIYAAGYIKATYANGSFPTLYRKQFALYDGTQCIWGWNGNSGSAFASMFMDYGGSTAFTVSIPGGWQNDKWFFIKAKFPNASPFLFEGWCNDAYGSSNEAGGHAGGTSWHELDTNHNETDSNFDCTQYWNRVVFSSNEVYEACKFEVSDNSTYGAGNKNYCFPISIDDTEGQFECDLTGLTGDTYYLWVTNSRNERVATAYDLSGGGGGGSSVTKSGKGSSFSYFR